jgi:hypothetical protein
MEILDFPEEILMEIFSKLAQRHRHLTAALVCKRFLQLTRSPQLLKCVNYNDTGNFDSTKKSDNKVQSLLVMLRANRHLKKLTLKLVGQGLPCQYLMDILNAVKPHGSLRHLKLNIIPLDEDEEEWNQVFSQICLKLTSLSFNVSVPSNYFEEYLVFDYLAPLVNAKYLTTLKLDSFPSYEIFRQMADNYTCLQNVDFNQVDCSENSDVVYFLERQCETITNLQVRGTTSSNPPNVIPKCRNMKRLVFRVGYADLNGLKALSKLKYVSLVEMTNSDVGHSEASNVRERALTLTQP